MGECLESEHATAHGRGPQQQTATDATSMFHYHGLTLTPALTSTPTAASIISAVDELLTNESYQGCVAIVSNMHLVDANA